jgi:hypothetical protein
MDTLDPVQAGLGVLATCAAPHKATTSPIVTGSSVLAIKYRDGVMMCADTLGSYGSMAKFTDLCRLRAVGQFTLLGASGEYSDFQYIMDLLDELVRWAGRAFLQGRAAGAPLPCPPTLPHTPSPAPPSPPSLPHPPTGP